MLVHVKAYDAWTRKLLELVREKGPAISVRVQGPYLGGTPVLRPEAGDNAVVVVAGGHDLRALPILGLLASIPKHDLARA
jgi:hypothetical protein